MSGRWSHSLRLGCYQLFPFLELLEAQLLRWHEAATSTGPFRDQFATLQQHIQEVLRWKDVEPARKIFQERLREEHQRLDVIENKSRAVLASSSLMVALAAFVSTNSDVLDGNALGMSLRLVAFSAFIYLAIAVFASLRAGGMGARWYVDPADLDNALRHPDVEATPKDVLTLAVSLTYKDLMADTTYRKERALRISMGCLRNGLVLFVIAISATLALRSFSPPIKPVPKCPCMSTNSIDPKAYWRPRISSTMQAPTSQGAVQQTA